MADSLKGAAAPILPAALAVSFSPVSRATPRTMSERMDELASDATALHAVMTVCNDFLAGDDRSGVLLNLAERVAKSLVSALTDSDWSAMARADVAELQGGVL